MANESAPSSHSGWTDQWGPVRSTATGDREVLGVDVGDSEDEVFWKRFLRSLRQGGWAGCAW